MNLKLTSKVTRARAVTVGAAAAAAVAADDLYTARAANRQPGPAGCRGVGSSLPRPGGGPARAPARRDSSPGRGTASLAGLARAQWLGTAQPASAARALTGLPGRPQRRPARAQAAGRGRRGRRRT